MMENKDAYNTWSSSYDTVENKTRDLEAKVIRSVLPMINFSTVLELGCGTGKNTEWLVTKAKHITAVDFSTEMQDKAKAKINTSNIDFRIADITKDWDFISKKVDLITCSLVLEHIENIDLVFEQAAKKLESGGHFYIGELHPFKQYQGSKARFDSAGGTFTLECFIHHISDFMEVAKKNSFSCVSLKEWFDENDDISVPRIVSFLFKKN